MFHLTQLLLKLLLQAEGELPDNLRLVGSVFIGGVWLIPTAELFPLELGPWRDWCVWGGWICVGLAAFLPIRRRIWKWQGRQPKRDLRDLEMTAKLFDEPSCGSYTPRRQRTLR